jgi:hypothetical protein
LAIRASCSCLACFTNSSMFFRVMLSTHSLENFFRSSAVNILYSKSKSVTENRQEVLPNVEKAAVRTINRRLLPMLLPLFASFTTQKLSSSGKPRC